MHDEAGSLRMAVSVAKPQFMLFKERNYPVVEHIGSDKGILSAVLLGKSDFGVSANQVCF